MKLALRILLAITAPIWFIPWMLWIVAGELMEDTR